MEENIEQKPIERKVEKSFTVEYYEDNTIDFKSETLKSEEIIELIKKLSKQIETEELIDAVVQACVKGSFNGAHRGATEAIANIAKMREKMNGNTEE